MKPEPTKGTSGLHQKNVGESSSDLFGDDKIYSAARQAYEVSCRIAKAIKNDLSNAAFWTADHVEDACRDIHSHTRNL